MFPAGARCVPVGFIGCNQFNHALKSLKTRWHVFVQVHQHLAGGGSVSCRVGQAQDDGRVFLNGHWRVGKTMWNEIERGESPQGRIELA